MIQLLKLDSIESSINHIKFPDGTLIQFGSCQKNIDKAGKEGSATFYFPITFIDDRVFLFCSNIYANLPDVIYSPSVSKNGATVYFSTANNEFKIGNNVYFKWMAIGRWK